MLGSSWPAEEALAAGFLEQYPGYHLKVIVAPHDIRPDRIAQVCKTFAEAAGRCFTVNTANPT